MPNTQPEVAKPPGRSPAQRDPSSGDASLQPHLQHGSPADVAGLVSHFSRLSSRDSGVLNDLSAVKMEPDVSTDEGHSPGSDEDGAGDSHFDQGRSDSIDRIMKSFCTSLDTKIAVIRLADTREAAKKEREGSSCEASASESEEEESAGSVCETLEVGEEEIELLHDEQPAATARQGSLRAASTRASLARPVAPPGAQPPAPARIPPAPVPLPPPPHGAPAQASTRPSPASVPPPPLPAPPRPSPSRSLRDRVFRSSRPSPSAPPPPPPPPPLRAASKKSKAPSASPPSSSQRETSSWLSRFSPTAQSPNLPPARRRRARDAVPHPLPLQASAGRIGGGGEQAGPHEAQELGLARLGERTPHTEATHGARRRSRLLRGESAAATSTGGVLHEADDDEGSPPSVFSGPTPLAPPLALDSTFAASDLGPVSQGASLEAASIDWSGATEPQPWASRLQSSHTSDFDGQASGFLQYVAPLATPQALEPAAKMKRVTEPEKSPQDALHDGAQEADGDGRRKKAKRGPVDTATPGDGGGKKFACPYFKRNPKKYRNWTSCPGPGWDEVHRVKSACQTAFVNVHGRR